MFSTFDLKSTLLKWSTPWFLIQQDINILNVDNILIKLNNFIQSLEKQKLKNYQKHKKYDLVWKNN